MNWITDHFPFLDENRIHTERTFFVQDKNGTIFIAQYMRNGYWRGYDINFGFESVYLVVTPETFVGWKTIDDVITSAMAWEDE